MDDRIPILVGCGQVLQRDVDPREALAPREMMELAARRAAEDAQGGRRMLAGLDFVGAPGILGWPHPNPARLLAEKLGSRPTREVVTSIGGNFPQSLVNHVAEEVRAGRVRSALLVGTEVIRTRHLARRHGIELSWKNVPTSGVPPAELIGDTRPAWNDLEQSYGLFLPIHMYPLFENALRAQRGWDLPTHREKLGRLCSRMTETAARNPYAWFPQKRSPAEITTPGTDNRMIAFPYTKRMNAIMEVDQSAAILMTSTAGAKALGIPEERWVYLRGGADADEEDWFVSERRQLHTSTGLREATSRALRGASLEAGDIDAFDLYSCFPSAVQIAADVLGIAEDDPRPLTLTGGLPYAGGPGNAYSLHGIASMMDWLRERPGSRGMVTGVGWFLSKHAAGVYSTASPEDGEAEQEVARVVPKEGAAVTVAGLAEGPARIETYSVFYDREGAPERGIVVARQTDEEGRRALAALPADPALLEAFVAEEGVGRSGRLVQVDGKNRFEPD